MRPFVRLIVFTLLAVDAGIVLLFSYYLLWPYATIKFSDLTILTPTVAQGTDLRYQLTYCKSIDAPAKTQRNLVGQLVYVLPSATGDATPGCHTKISTIVIPANVDPGTYYIDDAVTYSVNPLRTVTVRYRTPSFQVTGITTNATVSQQNTIQFSSPTASPQGATSVPAARPATNTSQAATPRPTASQTPKSTMTPTPSPVDTPDLLDQVLDSLGL